jgi:hypothetical protein
MYFTHGNGVKQPTCITLELIYSETCITEPGTNRQVISLNRWIWQGLNKTEFCINWTLNKTESCINWTLNKTESCINWTLNKAESCINWTLNKTESCINSTLNKTESCINLSKSQDSGLFRVWLRQVYTGFWFIQGLA